MTKDIHSSLTRCPRGHIYLPLPPDYACPECPPEDVPPKVEQDELGRVP